MMNNYYFCSVSKEYNANDNIEQILVQVDENDKVYKLHEILQSINGSVLSKQPKLIFHDKLYHF